MPTIRQKMYYDEIIGRLNRVGGLLLPVPGSTRDDPRAALSSTFHTSVWNVFVRVVDTPDVTLASLCGGDANPLPQKIANKFMEAFGNTSIAIFKKSPQELVDKDSEMMVEFTNYIARELS